MTRLYASEAAGRRPPRLAQMRRNDAALALGSRPSGESRLNIAEIELSALGRQCLAQRIAHQDALRVVPNLVQPTSRSEEEAIRGVAQAHGLATVPVASPEFNVHREGSLRGRTCGARSTNREEQ